MSLFSFCLKYHGYGCMHTAHFGTVEYDCSMHSRRHKNVDVSVPFHSIKTKRNLCVFIIEVKAIPLSTRFFYTSINGHGYGVLPIASVSGQAQTEQNGNGTEIHRWYVGYWMANGHCSNTCQAVYHWRLLHVVDRLSVAWCCAVELTARETVCHWRLPRGADCSRRPVSVAGGCSVELTAQETVCLKTGIAPSLPSQYRQLAVLISFCMGACH